MPNITLPTLTPDLGAARLIETSAAHFVYTAAMRAEDAAAGAASLRVEVVQRGTLGLSRAAMMILVV